MCYRKTWVYMCTLYVVVFLVWDALFFRIFSEHSETLIYQHTFGCSSTLSVSRRTCNFPSLLRWYNLIELTEEDGLYLSLVCI